MLFLVMYDASLAQVCSFTVCFMRVCISGLLKNSGITANPLPNQERVYLLTTATAPYCGVYDFVHIVIYQKSTLTDNVGINQCWG